MGYNQASIAKVIAAASTNETEVKASAGRVAWWNLINQHATNWAWLKFYNATTGTVVVGTTVPILTIGIPPGGGNAQSVPQYAGLVFDTAITYAITGDEPDADTTAVAAGQVTGSIGYL